MYIIMSINSTRLAGTAQILLLLPNAWLQYFDYRGPGFLVPIHMVVITQRFTGILIGRFRFHQAGLQ